MAGYYELMTYINEMAEAKGYGQDYVNLLKDCAEWADDNQWNEIREGLENGVDVSVYADSEFDDDQMAQIRWGLEDGFDVSVYADPKFDYSQMKQIRGGLESGVDVSIYADPKYDWVQMALIRLGLESGVDVLKYADPQFGDWVVNRTERNTNGNDGNTLRRGL